MHLRDGEIALKVVTRHLTPYVLSLVKILAIAIPFYVLLFYIGRAIGNNALIYILAFVSFFVGIIITMITLDYILDKLIITNKRVIWINWKTLFKREEHEAELMDIQDIETREKGILSKWHIMDYGLLQIATASSTLCISFEDCPDPEGIKHFIILQMEKMYSTVQKNHTTPQPGIVLKPEEWSVN
ncbi:MAG: hypothetical protein WCT53_00365 [Candidatus Gracilibacteria bacterium]